MNASGRANKSPEEKVAASQLYDPFTGTVSIAETGSGVESPIITVGLDLEKVAFGRRVTRQGRLRAS